MAWGRTHVWALLAAGLAGGAVGPAQAKVEVAASISPIHSLVAGVMEGRRSPALLLRAGESEHSTVLRPTTALALSRAKIVFRVAQGFETALDKPIVSLARASPVVELARAPGLTLLGARKLDEKRAPVPARPPEPLHIWADLHIWLDPANAKAMTAEIARRLSALDPEGATIYAANADRQMVRLDALDRTLTERLVPIAHIPYVVFHDAYQYFEARYGLNEVGRVEIAPERAPSVRHLAELRAKIKSSGAVCVFAEPQIEPRVLPTLIEGLNVRTGILDPLGVDHAPGPLLYDQVLLGLASSLKACLQP